MLPCGEREFARGYVDFIGASRVAGRRSGVWCRLIVVVGAVREQSISFHEQHDGRSCLYVARRAGITKGGGGVRFSLAIEIKISQAEWSTRRPLLESAFSACDRRTRATAAALFSHDPPSYRSMRDPAVPERVAVGHADDRRQRTRSSSGRLDRNVALTTRVGLRKVRQRYIAARRVSRGHLWPLQHVRQEPRLGKRRKERFHQFVASTGESAGGQSLW